MQQGALVDARAAALRGVLARPRRKQYSPEKAILLRVVIEDGGSESIYGWSADPCENSFLDMRILAKSQWGSSLSRAPHSIYAGPGRGARLARARHSCSGIVPRAPPRRAQSSVALALAARA